MIETAASGLGCSETTCVGNCFFAGKLGVGVGMVFLLWKTLDKWPILLHFLHMASLYLHQGAVWLVLPQRKHLV